MNKESPRAVVESFAQTVADALKRFKNPAVRRHDGIADDFPTLNPYALRNLEDWAQRLLAATCDDAAPRACSGCARLVGSSLEMLWKNEPMCGVNGAWIYPILDDSRARECAHFVPKEGATNV